MPMSRQRRGVILKLAAAAYEMDLDAMTGSLHRNEEGRWLIGEQQLESWLEAHEGEEVVVLLASLDEEREIETRTCRTCGRDYADIECPYCRENRIRLRGR
jgi:hypothetical protein